MSRHAGVNHGLTRAAALFDVFIVYQGILRPRYWAFLWEMSRYWSHI